MSQRYGTDHPEVIDVITEKDDTCYLYVIQDAELDDERTLALQTKLNNYLAFILDGQLAEEYPSKAQLQKVIRIELQYPATGVAAEFLERIEPYLQKEGVGFEVGVHSARMTYN